MIDGEVDDVGDWYKACLQELSHSAWDRTSKLKNSTTQWELTQGL